LLGTPDLKFGAGSGLDRELGAGLRQSGTDHSFYSLPRAHAPGSLRESGL